MEGRASIPSNFTKSEDEPLDMPQFAGTRMPQPRYPIPSRMIGMDPTGVVMDMLSEAGGHFNQPESDEEEADMLASYRASRFQGSVDR